MRDFGCIQSPQHAFLLNLGLESLHVRMPRHVENGQAVAEFLQEQPQVSYVNYSGLPTDRYYTLAQNICEWRMWCRFVRIKGWTCCG